MPESTIIQRAAEQVKEASSKEHLLRRRIEGVVARAEKIILYHCSELQELNEEFQLRARRNGKEIPTTLTELTLELFLSKVTHDVFGRHRRVRIYATAYYRKCKIVYNPVALLPKIHDDKFLVDLVLHELGHLIDRRFLGGTGHGEGWRRIGEVVGYATVGATSDSRRSAYPTYAAKIELVSAHCGAPVGQVVDQPTYIHSPQRPSAVQSPVRLVWDIAESMRGWPRKDVIAECVLSGININTAKTQYQRWFKERGWMYR